MTTGWTDSSVESAPSPGRRVLIWCEGAVAGVWIGVRSIDSRFTYRIDEPVGDQGDVFVRARYWRDLPGGPDGAD